MDPAAPPEPPDSPDVRRPAQRGWGGDSPELEAERARRLRRFSAWAQAGGAAFLGVVSLGMLPTIIASVYPAAGERLAVAIWVLAPAIPIVLLVVAAFRLPR